MHTLPELPYAYNALEPYIDEQTMHLHHEKHHAAYVKNVNDFLKDSDLLNLKIEDLVKSLDKVPQNLRQKVRNNAGGHLNHSMFWLVMSPKATSPQGKLKQVLESTFDSVDSFKDKFTAAAMGRFGSGWVWLIKDNGKLSIVDTQNQDSPLIDGKSPLLCLDVWEHAYYLKYQNRRVDYIKAWWNIVNWNEVNRRFLES